MSRMPSSAGASSAYHSAGRAGQIVLGRSLVLLLPRAAAQGPPRGRRMLLAIAICSADSYVCRGARQKDPASDQSAVRPLAAVALPATARCCRGRPT